MARSNSVVCACRHYFNLSNGDEELAVELFKKDFALFNTHVDPSGLVSEIRTVFASYPDAKGLTTDFIVAQVWQNRGMKPADFASTQKEVKDFLAECREKVKEKLSGVETEREGRFAGRYFVSSRGPGGGWIPIVGVPEGEETQEPTAP